MAQRRTIAFAALIAIAFAAIPAAAQFYQSAQAAVDPADADAESNHALLVKLEASLAELRGEIASLQGTITGLEATTDAARGTTSRTDGAGQVWPTLLTAFHAYNRQIEGLRTEVAALSGATPGEKTFWTREQEAQRKAIARELRETEKQLAAVQKAIDEGLDPRIVEGTVTSLEARSGELTATLEQMRGAGALLYEHGVNGAEGWESGEVTIEPMGLCVDFGLASAYIFRGWNVFMDKAQKDQHALFSPGLTYALDSGLWFSYVGAFQWSGDNQALMVDAGFGHEQDLIAGYDWELLPGRVAASTSLTYYFYPFASKEITGVSNPSYWEPSLALSYAGRADLGLQMCYFKEVQSDLGNLGYLYLHPSIGKEIRFSQTVGFSFGLGYGYKVFRDSAMKDYKHDLTFDWEIPLAVEGGLGITPGIHFGWTNIGGASRGEEYVVWTSVSTGFDL